MTRQLAKAALDPHPAEAPGEPAGEAGGVHVVEGALDVPAAAPLAMALRNAIGLPLKIDASGARSLGGLCFQILLAAAVQWKADRQSFAVVAPSDGFLRDFELLGGQAEDFGLHARGL